MTLDSGLNRFASKSRQTLREITARQPGETWESFAERRIRQAQAAGEFEQLAGFGQPIPNIDEPWDDNSWVKQKLRDEQINALPPILEARLDRERTLELIQQLNSEAEVRKQLTALNERITKAHFSSQTGPAGGVLPVDVDREIEQWRSTVRRDAEGFRSGAF